MLQSGSCGDVAENSLNALVLVVVADGASVTVSRPALTLVLSTLSAAQKITHIVKTVITIIITYAVFYLCHSAQMYIVTLVSILKGSI